MHGYGCIHEAANSLAVRDFGHVVHFRCVGCCISGSKEGTRHHGRSICLGIL